MDSRSFHTPFKVLAAVVLLLMLIAVLYAGYIAVSHWGGITV